MASSSYFVLYCLLFATPVQSARTVSITTKAWKEFNETRGCDPSKARCWGKTNCDELFLELIGYQQTSKGATTAMDECPKFYAKELLDPVMRCYMHANTLNPLSRSYLTPGPPDHLTFDCSDGPESQKLECDGPNSFNFIRNSCCKQAGDYLAPRCSGAATAGCVEWPVGKKCNEYVVDDDENLREAVADLGSVCEIPAVEHIRQFKWLSHGEFLEGVHREIQALQSSEQPIIHMMLLTSGGNDDAFKDDAVLWKSNLWMLATAWGVLSSLDRFVGVVLANEYSAYHQKGTLTKFSTCRKQEVLPENYHTLLLTDISYSAMEAYDTARFAMDYAASIWWDSDKSKFRPGTFEWKPLRATQCTYVMGAAFTGGQFYQDLLETGCTIRPGYTRGNHIESVANALITNPDNDSSRADLRKKHGSRLAAWILSLHATQPCFFTKRQLDQIPDFVAQHKIPDKKSIREVCERMGGLHEMLRHKLGLDKSKDWDLYVRPKLAPYKHGSKRNG